MAEIAVILRGWRPQMGETYIVCNLLTPRELIIKKFIVYPIWHFRRRRPCQLSVWVKNTSTY